MPSFRAAILDNRAASVDFMILTSCTPAEHADGYGESENVNLYRRLQTRQRISDPSLVINYPILEDVKPRYYKSFMYKTKKPGNIVREYIEHYTREGDIVLDPFCGSGVTGFEALQTGRKVILMDVNPVATFIADCVIKPADLKEFKRAYSTVRSKVRRQLLALYQTVCRACGKPALIICTTRRRAPTGVDELIDIRYYCKRCNKRRIDPPLAQDLALVSYCQAQVGKGNVPWYPHVNLKYPDGKDFKEGTHLKGLDSVASLFTERNIVVLATLLQAINELRDSDSRQFLRFCFMNITHLASKLCPVRKSRPFSSHWGRDTRYWVPEIYMESNAWQLFRRAVKGKQGFYLAKKDANERITTYRKAKSYLDLEKDANILILNRSVFDLPEVIPPCKTVDYVFTDPPYGGAIQHGELTTMWRAWLGLDLDFKEELTINEQQGKSFDFYSTMMNVAFGRVFDILKPGSYLTVTFHNTSTRVFNSAIKAPRYAGFDLATSPVYQEPRRVTLKALTQPFGSAEGDYYLNFVRPKTKTKFKELTLGAERQRRIIADAAIRILKERGEPTSFTDILRGIHKELSDHGYYPVAEEEASTVLKKSLGKEFVHVPVKNDNGAVIGYLWWFAQPDVDTEPPLEERVEDSILKILKREFKVSFGQILQEIFRRYTNALTPSPPSVRRIVEEYARPTKDGKWELKRLLIDDESQHSRMIGYLAEIGRKCRFKVWIGKEEQARGVFDKKSLSEYSEKVLDVQGLNLVSSEEIEQIDALWLKTNEIAYAFEVENTTQITMAVTRGSYLPGNPIRCMVIPEERQRLMYRRISAPVFRDKIESYNWSFLFYSDLERFFSECEDKSQVKLEDFQKLLKKLMPMTEAQEPLDRFMQSA